MRHLTKIMNFLAEASKTSQFPSDHPLLRAMNPSIPDVTGDDVTKALEELKELKEHRRANICPVVASPVIELPHVLGDRGLREIPHKAIPLLTCNANTRD